MANKVRAHVFVEGRVQGVFFRDNTCRKARESGIAGWVKNLPDGRVEAVFEGDQERVDQIIEWSKKGPAIAKVSDVDIKWEEYQGEFKNFEVRF